MPPMRDAMIDIGETVLKGEVTQTAPASIRRWWGDGVVPRPPGDSAKQEANNVGRREAMAGQLMSRVGVVIGFKKTVADVPQDVTM